MISVYENGNVYDMRGKAADLAKLKAEGNVGVTNGSSFFVFDVSPAQLYIYDKESNEWRLQ